MKIKMCLPKGWTPSSVEAESSEEISTAAGEPNFYDSLF